MFDDEEEFETVVMERRQLPGPRRTTTAPTQRLERVRNQAPPRPGRPIDPYRVMRALWRGKIFFLVAGVVGCILGYGIAKFVMPRTYESHTSMLYEGFTEETGMPAIREMRTMVDSVKLATNLEIVKKKVNFDGRLSSLSRNISVSFENESDLITILARSDSATNAAQLANTVVLVFLDHQKLTETQRRVDTVRAIESDIKSSTETLGKARSNYDDFRKENGISDLPAERQQAISAAAELRASADRAKAEAASQVALLASLKEISESKTVVVKAKNAGTIKPQLAAAKAELVGLRAQLTPDHPRVQAAEQRVKSLKAQLNNTESVTASGNTSDVRKRIRQARLARDVALQQETQFRKMADDAQGRLTTLSEAEGDASTLLAAVSVAEARIKTLNTDLAKARDQARKATSGFRVVSPAVVPIDPQGSKKRWAVAAGVPVLLVLFALFALLFKEFKGLRLRSPAEVAFWGKGPVIGSTTWPADQAALDDLVHELDDYAPDADGTMLVVGCRDDEKDLAEELSARLNRDQYEPTVLLGRDEGSIRPSLPPPQGTGPYAAVTGTALAKPAPEVVMPSALSDEPPGAVAEAWHGPSVGPAVRRAARLADRVLVIVYAGTMGAFELAKLPTRLGRDAGIGYLLVGLSEEQIADGDRAGEVEEFWQSRF